MPDFLNKINENLDKYLTIFGLINSLFLIIFLLITNQRVIYIISGILIFFSLLLWLLIRRNCAEYLFINSSKRIYISCIILFIILFTISIASLYFQTVLYQRPVVFFILISLMAGIIAIENIYSPNNVTSILLFQILLLGLNIVWSQQLLFPSIVGVDSWEHQYITNSLINIHSIPHSGYEKLPIFHILISVSMIMTNLNYKFTSMISISLFLMLCNILFMYLIGFSLFNNKKIGIYSSLLITISNYPIFFYLWSIPNSFAIIYVLIVLYFLWNSKKIGVLYSYLLIIIVMIVLILTHPVTTMYLAIILIFTPIIQEISIYFDHYKKLDFTFILSLLFCVMMLGWWIYGSNSVKTLTSIINIGFGNDYFAQKTPVFIINNYISKIPFFEQFLGQIGQMVFFSLSIVGILFLISKKDVISRNLAIIGILPLIIGFGGIISGTGLLEQRWFYFAQILLSTAVSFSIIIIYNKINLNFFLLSKFFILIFFSGIAFLMIIPPISNIDNPFFTPNSSIRYSFTESELASVNIISTYSNQLIYTDDYVVDSLNFQYKNLQSFGIEIIGNNLKNMNLKNIFLREEIINKPFKLLSGIIILDYNPYKMLNNLKYNKIIDCGKSWTFEKK